MPSIRLASRRSRMSSAAAGYQPRSRQYPAAAAAARLASEIWFGRTPALASRRASCDAQAVLRDRSGRRFDGSAAMPSPIRRGNLQVQALEIIPEGSAQIAPAQGILHGSLQESQFIPRIVAGALEAVGVN